jgi:hypothetical protein
MTEKRTAIDVEGYLKPLMDTVRKIITDPAGFFREMPTSGGLADPVVFMVSMGVAAGIIHALLEMLGLGVTGSFRMALASIIFIPIAAVIGGFIGAAILFVIWKALGSQQPFEVSFRCMAYSMAITPITTVLGAVPYIGSILGLVWMTYLLVNASVEVHGIQAKTAWIVLGAVCAVLALTSISTQLAARRTVQRLNSIPDISKMKPEEAGQAMGEFLKGFQKGAGK